MSRLIPPAPEGVPAELTITLPADDIAVIHGMLAADGKQMIQSGVPRAVEYGHNLFRIARAIDHQANAQMPGSADPVQGDAKLRENSGDADATENHVDGSTA